MLCCVVELFGVPLLRDSAECNGTDVESCSADARDPGTRDQVN